MATRDTIILVPEIGPISVVLAVDTTTRGGSVAVARDGSLIAVLEGDATRTHAERMPAEIEAALKQARVQPQELDLLVVSSGPGAFTGLRIGLAAIQGLAMVLGKPVVGVSALDALIDAAHQEAGIRTGMPVVAWMDAARGEVFATATELLEPMVGSPEDMLRALPLSPAADVTFVGDGALRYRDQILEARPHARVLEAVPLIAPALARLGQRRAAAGEAGPPHALQPLYVRRPDAELDRERHAKA